MGGVPRLAAFANKRHKIANNTLFFRDVLFLGHKKGFKRLIVC
jgi:hypothetical protein